MRILPLLLLLLLSANEMYAQEKPTFFNKKFKKVKERKGVFVTHQPFEAEGKEILLLITKSSADSSLVTFLDGKFIQQKPYTPEDSKTLVYYEEPGEKIYEKVDEPPAVKGGMEAYYRYMKQNMRYPSEAIRANQQGRVYVQFIVTKEGKVAEAKVVKGVCSSIDAEALRIIKNSGEDVGWEPGYIDGQAVHTRMVIPIVFRHNGIRKKRSSKLLN